VFQRRPEVFRGPNTALIHRGPRRRLWNQPGASRLPAQRRCAAGL